MMKSIEAAATALALVGFAVTCAGTARGQDASLIAAAEKEGEVTWYTTLIVNQAVRPLIQAFEAKYRGITVRYSRGDSGPNALKIMNEARVGAPAADVFDGIDTASPLLRAGLVEQFVPAAAGQYPPEFKDKSGRWIATNLYFFTPGVNTNLVPLASAPKTFDALLDPKWKGKMAWTPNPPAGSPIFVGNVLQAMGEDKGMTYLRQLAKQNIINVDATARAILDQVITGEYPVALVIFNHHAALSAASGAPVAWVKLEPVPAALSVVGLLKHAPHPNAAKLLIDFLASKEGQQIFAAVNYLPAMPSVPAKIPSLKPKEGRFKANFMSPQTLAEDMPKWTRLAHEIFP
jgi:iron(III) transport system substrate-binding protein